MVFVTLIVVKTNRRTLLLKRRRETPRAGARRCKPTRPRPSSPPSSYRTVSDALIIVFPLITVFVVVIVVIVGISLFFMLLLPVIFFHIQCLRARNGSRCQILFPCTEFAMAESTTCEAFGQGGSILSKKVPTLCSHGSR